jgi:tetratricopeptide (TPR) repeat protein
MQRKFHVFTVLAVVLISLAAAGCDKLKARDLLNKGVNAYKSAQFDVAIEDFKQAKELDPTLTNAQLYLATAYASQYIPGAPSADNIRNGEQAIAEFKQILQNDPNNLSALDGIGSILYNMAGTPFDASKMDESKTYHQKHMSLKADDPEPYYWIGVIDWSLAYRGNKDVREEFNNSSKKPLKEGDPMPPALATQFSSKFGQTVDEGITGLQKAIQLKPDYDDAMAYLNLLYRQKADMETAADARATDLKNADDLVDKVKAIKQKKMENPQPPPAS